MFLTVSASSTDVGGTVDDDGGGGGGDCKLVERPASMLSTFFFSGFLCLPYL